MKFLSGLFLAITLLLSPSAAFCRDVNKYTVEYNNIVIEELAKELYRFVATLDKLENKWPDRRYITTESFDIIDKYNCNEKLYVINRGLSLKITNDKITHIYITIFVMNSLELVDKVFLKLDIKETKKGVPLKLKKSREEI